MSETDLPEPDRVEGVPHPRETYTLFGHEEAEQTFLDAVKGGKLHHAWMITGPSGIGKATLAWRMARYLLALPPDDGPSFFGEPDPPPDTLESDPHAPLNARIEALSEPRLMLIRRGPTEDGKRLKTQISVDEVRKLNGFFGLSATDGGYRVVIVDCLDEMNTASANALLKLLEEPPKNAVLLLICHQPSKVLPTIRSRCRELRLSSLTPEAMAKALRSIGSEIEASPALAEIGSGSIGRTLALLAVDGVEMYRDTLEILSTCPRLDREKALRLAETASARGKEARLDAQVEMLDLALSRIAKAGVGALPADEIFDGEYNILHQLAPSPEFARQWAVLQQEARARIGHGRAVNVAPASLLLDVFLKAAEIAPAS